MDTIVTTGLTRNFGDNIAVNNISISVKEGEVFGLVGPDGAGKTTVMRLLAGLMAPTYGDAWVYGCNTIKDSEQLKNYISYMPQRFGLYLDLTVQENIDFYADLYNVSRKKRKEKIAELLAFSNMTPFRDRQAKNLSGGMKQKLALACALVHTPKVLLLDEPTNGVDPLSRRDFWRILYQLLEEKVTIFVSTAYLDEAERCSKIGLLHQGKMIISGTPDEIKSQIPGILIGIRCKKSREVIMNLKKELSPLSASLFGDKIHVVLPGESTQILQIVKQLLTDMGVNAETEIINPSLEDIFISMIASDTGGVSNVS
ncbi:multidrug ABC transporter ATP-binding protein [Megasphaera cerevisiae DSM 20462]|uniref:Multidrug ABC transporter ATP-binding protein n=1 Tax=Megasphaera cerevisiae DSM 20462 TaxID=1122219 RepID=A0A0J6WWV1_9FIRM|nr:ABC transporter ATP-binding protein [Megasphaera cerevisiae]KMO86317.1 multidrug ABC transporter ATP-binding protein [Megasphaera cerevisiae DSM 20462]OKY52927.1 multidrug ABC transporter ATP-binding protein [Megasphaera cerevisiae]SKA00801.1 ABC-2 type transport system ATP-binding protein [Megasphaera cerevisiae DSM 20462]